MEKTTARLEAFSDGVFGVAITLLAIEIGIEEYDGATNANLWYKAIHLWPEYVTYFTSFATILLMWMGHHKILNHLRGTNRWVILSNGLVLLFVVLFPFPNKLVGTFVDSYARNTAIAIYTGFTGAITLSLFLLNLTILHNPHLLMYRKKSVPWIKAMMRGQIIGFLIYEGVAVLAIYYPVFSLVISFFMWIFWFLLMKDDDEDEMLEGVENH